MLPPSGGSCGNSPFVPDSGKVCSFPRDEPSRPSGARLCESQQRPIAQSTQGSPVNRGCNARTFTMSLHGMLNQQFRAAGSPPSTAGANARCHNRFLPHPIPKHFKGLQPFVAYATKVRRPSVLSQTPAHQGNATFCCIYNKSSHGGQASGFQVSAAVRWSLLCPSPLCSVTHREPNVILRLHAGVRCCGSQTSQSRRPAVRGATKLKAECPCHPHPAYASYNSFNVRARTTLMKTGRINRTPCLITVRLPMRAPNSCPRPITTPGTSIGRT